MLPQAWAWVGSIRLGQFKCFIYAPSALRLKCMVSCHKIQYRENTITTTPQKPRENKKKTYILYAVSNSETCGYLFATKRTRCFCLSLYGSQLQRSQGLLCLESLSENHRIVFAVTRQRRSRNRNDVIIAPCGGRCALGVVLSRQCPAGSFCGDYICVPTL